MAKVASTLPTGSHACQCQKARHQTKRIVLTGGPGGGKTAVLEMARRYFCHHVGIAPESASIVFGGGFPRSDSPLRRRRPRRSSRPGLGRRNSPSKPKLASAIELLRAEIPPCCQTHLRSAQP